MLVHFGAQPNRKWIIGFLAQFLGKSERASVGCDVLDRFCQTHTLKATVTDYVIQQLVEHFNVCGLDPGRARAALFDCFRSGQGVIARCLLHAMKVTNTVGLLSLRENGKTVFHIAARHRHVRMFENLALPFDIDWASVCDAIDSKVCALHIGLS
jgi:hypothetical protein